MQFGRGVKDLDRLFLEPRAGQERRFHQEPPQVEGVRRAIGLARADGPLVVSTRREGLRAVEFPGGIPHLGRSRERLRGFGEKTAASWAWPSPTQGAGASSWIVDSHTRSARSG